jgi:Mn-dependent DtxR family transcriptional regulator
MDVIITFNKQIIKNKFKHPYTKIEFVEKDLKVSRITAANYLNKLSDDGILTKKKLGVTNYYINHELFDVLSK